MIILYGYLAKKYGKKIKCEVNSVYELVLAAEANRPGFRSSFLKDRNYLVRRGDTLKKGKDVSEEEIEMRFRETTWHVLPMPIGYGGELTFIAGAIITAIGVYVPGAQFLIPIGVSLMLSGVAQMLAPSPGASNYSDRESPDKRPSYLFDGPYNRTAAGGAVPVVYGKDVFVGSTFVSGGILIGDV